MRRAIALFIVLTGAGATAGCWYAWRDLHTPASPPAGGVIVTVASGASFKTTAIQLQRAGVLRHPLLLTAWARYYQRDRRIHRGDYRITRPLTPLDLLDLLESPDQTLQWVTIPEGYTAEQVAATLEQKGFGGRDVFLCTMHDASALRDLSLPASGVEGYLFPDTYAFTWAMDPPAILRSMVDRFRKESAALADRRRAAGMSEEQMVTLASVIEKETGRAEERPLISGVFHNRLRIGMPLQSDPTVIYGLRDFNGNLTHADLASPLPYNTYAHRGLPPGPIANPGRAALEAAVTPAKTDALYFVSRNDGTHQFSDSLAEHNRAVQRYQKRR